MGTEFLCGCLACFIERPLAGDRDERISSEKACRSVRSDKAIRKEDAEIFLMAVQKIKNPGDLARVEAILQVSVNANRELYAQMYMAEQDQERRQDYGLF